jgi:hypothetical protein
MPWVLSGVQEDLRREGGNMSGKCLGIALVFFALYVETFAYGATTYVAVDLTGIANGRLGHGGAQDLPAGRVVLGGISFYIPENVDNLWTSNQGSGTISVDIPVGVYSATDVHTLINTSWGQVGPYTKLEFYGSNGTYFAKDLYGNSDIRDWLQSYWTNYINGTTTIEVWSGVAPDFQNRACRIDKQHIVLPEEFKTETLTYIRISDWGASEFHRAFLMGVTVAVGDGMVSGHVTLQGAVNHSSLITFELSSPGWTDTVQVMTGTDGRYDLNDVAPGTYEISAKGSKWLRAKVAGVVVLPGTTTSQDFYLIGGDANDSNSVNVLDLNILKGTYGKAAGQLGYDARADFNNSDSVNVLDLNILKSNYGKMGD